MKKTLKTIVLATLATTSLFSANNVFAQETLEFYHGHHQDAAERPSAGVMRDIYQKFADEYSTDEIVFEPIPVSGDLVELMNNEVAAGSFPDIIDLAGNTVSLAAISQDLVFDILPFVEENELQNNIGINYEQNQVNGKIFTVHDTLSTLGLWYNAALFEEAGAATPDQWENWDDFNAAMAQIREIEGVYGFGAGEPSLRIFNAALGLTEEGRGFLNQELTAEVIQSDAFAEALRATMQTVNKNGAANAGQEIDVYQADFIEGKSAVFFNGVWAGKNLTDNQDIEPGIFPGNIGIDSAGGGITISNQLTDAEKEIAQQFVEYMFSDEVQEQILIGRQSNIANNNVDKVAVAEETGDEKLSVLVEAVDLVDQSTQINEVGSAWGGDVRNVLINAFNEASAEGIDIDAKVSETQDILLALIG